MILVSYTTTSKPTIYVIGDSTASVYGADLYPRTGWAQIFQPFFNSDSVLVSDKAASGRSSKSFYEEKGKWDVVSQLFKPGDYLFIQFAHNDEKTEADRHTDPQTTFKDYLNIYINGARDKGAYPVLLSSIPRNNWSGSGIQQAHKEYTIAMKEVADSASVPFIDMEASTMAYLNSKGKTYSTDSVYNNLKANVWPNYLTGNSDGTHLQEKGAFELCQVLVADLMNLEGFPEIERLKTNTKTALRISAMPYPNLKGTISGYGIFYSGKMASLTAKPIAGYEFAKWTLAGDTSTYSTNSSIGVQLDSVSLNFVAHFESTTSNAIIKSSNNVKIYPNPVSDQVVLSLDNCHDKVEVQFLNMKGEVLKNESVFGDDLKIDVTDLSSGVYFLSIQCSEGKYVKKMIKK